MRLEAQKARVPLFQFFPSRCALLHPCPLRPYRRPRPVPIVCHLWAVHPSRPAALTQRTEDNESSWPISGPLAFQVYGEGTGSQYVARQGLQHDAGLEGL